MFLHVFRSLTDYTFTQRVHETEIQGAPGNIRASVARGHTGALIFNRSHCFDVDRVDVQSYISPLEQISPCGDNRVQDGPDIKSILNIRQIASLHLTFRSLIPASTSPEPDWAHFFNETNSAMDKIYIDYVTHMPFALKRFKFEYLRNTAYRNILKVRHYCITPSRALTSRYSIESERRCGNRFFLSTVESPTFICAAFA